MKTKTKYRLIAIPICIVVYVIYLAIIASANFNRIVTIFFTFVLFSAIALIWRTAGKMAETKDMQVSIEDREKSEHEEQPATEKANYIDETHNSSEKSLSSEDNMPEPSDITSSESLIIPDNELHSGHQQTQCTDINDEKGTFNEELDTEKVDSSINEPIKDISKKTQSKDKSKILRTVTIIVLVVFLVAIVFSVILNAKHSEVKQLSIKGMNAYKDQLYELATKYFYDAYLLDSLNWKVDYMLGRCYYDRKDKDTAIKWYQEAYKNNPKKVDGHIGSETIYYKDFLHEYIISSNDKELALLLSQELFCLYPNDIKSYWDLAISCISYSDEQNNVAVKKKYQKLALQWANEMVEKFPNEFRSYLVLGYVQSFMEELLLSAIENYKKCISINPQEYTPYNNMGWCYKELKQYDEAFKCWRKAMELGDTEYAPNNLEYYGQLN